MNRHSLIFKITIFFVTIFLSINILLYFYHTTIKNNLISMQAGRYIQVLAVIKNNIKYGEEIVLKRLNDINISLVKQSDVHDILLNSKVSLIDDVMTIYDYKGEQYVKLSPPRPLPPRHLLNRKDDSFDIDTLSNFIDKIKIKRPKEFKYTKKKGHRKPKRLEILFKDNSYEIFLFSKFNWYSYFFTFVIDFLLISFYIFLYKKFNPLKRLKDDVSVFASGNLDVSTKIKGKDEIADLSNEFNVAIKRIKELTESRNLFLRNIMHELKTPITKGKLISDTLNESRKKEILQKAFYRLEYLLGEFAKIEELTSGKIKLNKNDFIVEELLDQAMDILLLDDTKLDIQLIDKIINVDFELFSIALKNLIDNSIKYNSNGNPEIVITDESITIRNKGIALKKDISEYLKPFNREYESIEKGLGLGLYISNNIINIHGFKLYYQYKDNYHNFKIIF